MKMGEIIEKSFEGLMFGTAIYGIGTGIILLIELIRSKND